MFLPYSSHPPSHCIVILSAFKNPFSTSLYDVHVVFNSHKVSCVASTVYVYPRSSLPGRSGESIHGEPDIPCTDLSPAHKGVSILFSAKRVPERRIHIFVSMEKLHRWQEVVDRYTYPSQGTGCRGQARNY